ncbi:hypothetical protein [Streptomyces sp. NBC_01511]|uniref:hypothetical protein n=1 Tax=Streptomyces sp. NBC_01511 TaxID=2903889 RepID=UPI0038642ED2
MTFVSRPAGSYPNSACAPSGSVTDFVRSASSYAQLVLFWRASVSVVRLPLSS